ECHASLTSSHHHPHISTLFPYTTLFRSIRFRVGAVEFVTQPEVERQVRPEPPVILDKEIVGVCAEIVGVGPELQRRLLRISQQTVREVISGVRYLPRLRPRAGRTTYTPVTPRRPARTC